MLNKKNTLTKEKFIKEDGRYLIFYQYKEDNAKTTKTREEKKCQK